MVYPPSANKQDVLDAINILILFFRCNDNIDEEQKINNKLEPNLLELEERIKTS